MRQVQITKPSIKNLYIIPIVLLTFLVVLLWHYFQIPDKSQPEIVEEVVTNSFIQEPIQPIPLINKVDTKKAKLGEKLFNEKRLSHNNKVSCATCHNLDAAGIVDTVEINGTIKHVNVTTVFNAKFNFRLFWDGHSSGLADQVDKLVQTLPALNTSWREVIAKLNQVPEYPRDFDEIYPDGITANNVSEAIAAFEETLITPNSRFDKFLRGDKNAISTEEKAGYDLFKSYGCVSCHQGINVGGNMFQRFGVMGSYSFDKGTVTKKDLGRFNLSKDHQDLYFFKVPSLRNVAVTPPYLHDGSAPTLEKAVGVMAKYQLGREIPSYDVALVVKFLKTLTGEYQGKPL